MSDELIIRPWTSVEEVPELLDVWRHSVEARRDLLSTADLDALAAALEAVYTEQVQVRVAQLGPQVVGFAAWSEQQIEMLWVRHHDRSQGVGRALLAEILAAAPNICVLVNSSNPAHLDFYRANGFIVVPGSTVSAGETRVRLSHVPVQELSRGTIVP